MNIGNTYAVVWEVVDKGRYKEVKLSTSRKENRGEASKLVGNFDRAGNTFYVPSNWSFVRFVGRASEMASNLEKGDRIQIKNGQITLEGFYNGEGQKQWPKSARITVFDFEFVDGGDRATEVPLTATVDEDSIPF